MNKVITYLLNLAMENMIGIDLAPLSPETPSMAIADENRIIINMNWHNQKELPFQIAHEIAHILNHDDGVLYFTTYASKSKYEVHANLTAVDLLIDYYNMYKGDIENVNVVNFMEQFGIPLDMENQVMDKLGYKFGI
ncbi:ImmA/IrrE family metallo-endopeptidase [Paucilactobacillus nenjiangensis]|uniref:ImmA/IrrE family metallo-endopeptidase n=1 Tax=Paucilactobacillus nenjiangensis TaxID=1296540 RepID=A0A5P1X5S0_9LACO|nr:ImmA/IrrE family metallo-endopeptidase [Paucilactobacillus nenjiangensis]QER67607.1 ImmA/IrrE family metallo-endopeptidase [Paucilactobacillus nenjiangensis]